MERKGEFSSYNDAKGSFADAKWHAADSKEYAKQSDISMQELKLDQETEDEFQRLKAAPKSLVVEKSSNPRNLRVVDGFKIKSMNMRDAATGALIWESTNWTDDMFKTEISTDVSKNILDCSVVSREIIFSSKEEIKNFKIEQHVYLHGNCIEEFSYVFGFVIPGSTNSWQQTIVAAPKQEMLTAEVLSGNVVFETSFYDGDSFLSKCCVRIFYV